MSGERKARRHCKAFTYAPKIDDVRSGKCKQTIRPLGDVQKGDIITFHGWNCKACGDEYEWNYKELYPFCPKCKTKHSYRTSLWSWRLEVEVKDVQLIEVYKEGIIWMGTFFAWNDLDRLAKKDGIRRIGDFGYGESMGFLLNKMYPKLPFYKRHSNRRPNGEPSMIIRWY